MHYLVVLQTLVALDDLLKYFQSSVLRYPFVLFDELVEVGGAILHHYIGVVFVLDDVVVLHNVGVIYHPQSLQLVLEEVFRDLVVNRAHLDGLDRNSPAIEVVDP